MVIIKILTAHPPRNGLEQAIIEQYIEMSCEAIINRLGGITPVIIEWKEEVEVK
jgi:hypothetical protein